MEVLYEYRGCTEIMFPLLFQILHGYVAVNLYTTVMIQNVFSTHTAIASGDMPPSYFVYTTGNGFPPIIESVPHALKGIGTAFMLALLTGKYVSSSPQ